MSQAEQYLRDGQLALALSALQNDVKADPANAKHRVFLFQLLSVIGHWERALTQLNVAGELDAKNLAMVQTYREAIRCEILRQKVFRGETTPLIFGEPEQWLANLIVALGLSAKGNDADAAELRKVAFDQAPLTAGTINDQAFEWLADADSRMGPVIEAIVNGKYYWIPFSRIAKISLDPPTDLRDLVWMPAQITWSNGGGSVALIPSRYPNTELAEDDSLRLARKTEWLEPFTDQFYGLGQRFLTTDVEDFALFGVRELILNTATGE